MNLKTEYYSSFRFLLSFLLLSLPCTSSFQQELLIIIWKGTTQTNGIICCLNLSVSGSWETWKSQSPFEELFSPWQPFLGLPYHSSCCYKCIQIQATEPGRARETLVMLWNGHWDLLPAAPQHNPTKCSFSYPSPVYMINESPGTTPLWTLLVTKFI